MGKLHSCIVAVALLLLPLQVCAEPIDAEFELLLDRAETQIWLGIANKGASDAFEEGLELVEQASVLLDSSNLPVPRQRHLEMQVDDVREQLEVLIDFHDDRFFGFYPLARLLQPTLLAEEGLAVTEQLFHPPEIAAIEIAARKFSDAVVNVDIPRVVIRSTPRNTTLENVAHSALARGSTTVPVSRRNLLKVLGTKGMESFDAGQTNSDMLVKIMFELNVESLIVLDISPGVGNGKDLVKYALRGDLYQHGEAIQGSGLDATPALRVARIVSFGTVLDRRDQFWPIILLQSALLIAAALFATRIHWSTERQLNPLLKAGFGICLFAIGRGFSIACIVFLGRIGPDPNALVAATWWWPCLLGLSTVLLSGLAARLGQARLTDVVPGIRGRAVGTVLGLTALGGASYFIAPVLLMDQSDGYLRIALYTGNAVAIAILFAYAVRSGPPVPTYFAIGPLLLAPALTSSLLMGFSQGLWTVTVLTVVLYASATVHHRYAAAHGTEEQASDAEDPSQVDQERLDRIAKKLHR